MDLALIVLRQTTIMFLLMAVGFVLYKKNIISVNGSRDFSKILISVVIPCVVIKSYLIESTPAKTRGFVVAFIVSALCLLVSMIISQLIYGRRTVVDNFGGSFSNAGFMGIPLISAIFGQEAVFYVSIYVALLNLLQQTYGVYIMTSDSSYIKPVKASTNPVLISVVLGLILYLFQVQMPAIIYTCIDNIATLNTPVAMIVLGVYLAQSDIKSVFLEKKLYFSSIVRLLIIPLVTMMLLSLIPVDHDIKVIELIAAAAPVGSNVAVFAQLHNQDYGYASKLVCNSTILSILTLPLIVLISSSFI